jgi:hypothetical protein
LFKENLVHWKTIPATATGTLHSKVFHLGSHFDTTLSIVQKGLIVITLLTAYVQSSVMTVTTMTPSPKTPEGMNHGQKRG